MRRPDLAAEWDEEGNAPHQLADFSFDSDYKAKWQCSKCDGYRWTASISSRTGRRFPECRHCRELRARLARSEDSLADYKDVAQQWHPTKNGVLRPEHVTPRSGKEVWWLCDKSICHHPHEWWTTIASRTDGSACPWCRKRQFCACDTLAARNPQLAKEWHPQLNRYLKPDTIPYFSGKVVSWQHVTADGDVHVWEAAVKSRMKGADCPKCPKSSKRAVPKT